MSSTRGVTALEAAIAVLVVGGGLLAASGYCRDAIRRSREVALAAELKNLRAGVMWYEAKHHERPLTLDAMIRSAMERMHGDRPWVMERGPARDTFGSPYRYDPATGAVRSTTPGYETW